MLKLVKFLPIQFYKRNIMFVLEKNHIYLNQSANDKQQALQLLGDILVKDKLTTADYLQGLQQRESQSSTYLGQGIAIPHGTPDSRDAILQTGVRVAHFPNGVDWGDGNTVHLAVVISAKSDEHLQVLQLLTKALNHDVAEPIRQAKTADDILQILNAKADSLQLHESLIKTGVHANDVDELAYHGYQLLKSQKLVGAGFLTHLHSNQAIYLNNDMWAVIGEVGVLNPAVAVLKNLQKLDFNGKKLDTLVVIASNANVDKDKLNNLLEILFQTSLHDVNNTKQIANLIQAETVPDWLKKTVIVPNAHGLHARPATTLVNLTKNLTGDIKVSIDDVNFVSAKSLTQLLSLGVTFGQTLTFIAEPNTDAEQALDSVILAVENGLGETVESLKVQNVAVSQSFDDWVEPFVDERDGLKGVSASRGLAVGNAFVVQEKRYSYQKFSQNSAQEKQQLDNAILQVKQNLQKTIDTASNVEIAQIFTAHLAMLDDNALLNPVYEQLGQGFSAPFAWHAHIEQTAQQQESLKNKLLAERAMDLRDIGDKVLAVLCGESVPTLPDEPYILIKKDLMPSDVARLDSQNVAGILTALGGASSHSAIVARALGIPAVVGAGESVLEIAQDMPVLINGSSGEFFINPSHEQLQKASYEQEKQHLEQTKAVQTCEIPAITLDNQTVHVMANLGDVKNAETAVKHGADGVGLLRTEFVFMKHSQMPDINAQIEDYKQVFDAMGKRPVVVRTLDIGGDKPLAYMPLPHEENPFLGVRGVRLSLRKPEMLKQQLIALIQASKQSSPNQDLRIMFPMIGRVPEWLKVREILQEVLAENPHNKLQVGMMIEVPSSAIIAEKFAPHVDFFSIGTNDLTQYALAIDRGHPVLSREADGLHPSVLKLIENTVKSAHKYGKWVGVCGELAADPQAVPILLGLGVDELSVSTSQIPLVKMQIRSLSKKDCQSIAEKALDCATVGEVRALTKG